MSLNTLVEQKNKLIADASALSTGPDFNPEVRSKIDQIITDITALDADIKRVQTIEEHRSSLRNPVNQPRPDPSESNDPEERAEVRNERQKASLRSYLQTGVIERRDLTVANSGVAIPVGFDATVIEARKSYGQIYDIVTVQETSTGEPIKVVLDNDTGNSLTAVTVGTNAAEADPALSGITLSVDNYTTGIIKVDNGFLMDAGFNVDSWIKNRFLKRFYRGASNLIVNGDGGAVESLLTSYETNFVATGTAATIGWNDLVALQAALDPDYQANACWAMSQVTLGYLLANIKSTTDFPLLTPMLQGEAAGFAGKILGVPVKIVTQLPTVATGNFPILYGDFKEGYTFRQVKPGIGILRLNEVFSAGYETGFVGFARVGGVVTDAGTHPVVSLKVS